ncbi:MAG: selenocysteine-specific translation elongation factor, partial [Acidimicrobiaceae bacterium]|nr:selenocysteine-specific translation elongation factor [Acidimicrobiaceae bacterium]
MRVVATAGHVDHGKSTLVHALTGEDPDRWAEEKARGLTIDLGFAATVLPSGAEVAFVDVPGHHRFVANMLAGVGAVDACLLVVAATEGWKPQSEEHLRILELVGVGHGVVALTKVGGLDDARRKQAEASVRERLAGSFLDGAEVVPVDVPAGLGLEELQAALGRLVTAAPAAADRGRPRLWVDRSFAMAGAGTVVTGTLAGGAVAVGDQMVVEPAGVAVRVRALQSHRQGLASAAPGRRLAINLAGIAHGEVGRGNALVSPGQWHLCSVFDAELRVLDGLEHAVTAKGAYVAYLGSAEVPVRLRVLGAAKDVAPGESGLVRLWLSEARRLPLLPGDRYVLRESGRSETVGGGEILDVAPV